MLVWSVLFEGTGVKPLMGPIRVRQKGDYPEPPPVIARVSGPNSIR